MKTLLNHRIAWASLLHGTDICPMVLWDAGMGLLDARQLFAQDIVNLWDKSPMVEIVQVEISRHFIARNGAEQVQETIENALDLIGLHGFGKYAVLSYILGTQSQELAGFSNPYDAKEPYNKLVQRIMVHERWTHPSQR